MSAVGSAMQSQDQAKEVQYTQLVISQIKSDSRSSPNHASRHTRNGFLPSFPTLPETHPWLCLATRYDATTHQVASTTHTHSLPTTLAPPMYSHHLFRFSPLLPALSQRMSAVAQINCRHRHTHHSHSRLDFAPVFLTDFATLLRQCSRFCEHTG